MSAFSTFTYAKKYYVSNEIEFETGVDTEFGTTYRIPDNLINLLSDNLVVYDKVGIGTTTPSRALEVIGNALISGITTFNRDIYLNGPLWDKFRNKGSLGQVLVTDGTGVFWSDVSGVGTPLQRIGIYDEGIFQGTVSNLNFLDGSDPNNLVNATISGINTAFANVVVSDRWSLSGLNVYRMSNVGIQNNNPSSTLDITGTLHATGAVDFDTTLNVDGAATLQTTLNVKGATDLDTTLNIIGITTLRNQLNVGGATSLASTLNVNGAATLQNTLNVKGATDLDTTLNVDGATVLQNTLNVKGATDLDTTLNVDGATVLQTTLNVKGATDLDTTLNVDGAATLQTTLNVKGATDLDTTLNVDGITTLRNQLNVGGASSLSSTLLVGAATTLNSTLQVGVGGTVITTTGIGSVGIGTYNPEFDIDLAKSTKFRKAIIDTNNKVGYDTNFYQTPRSVLTQVSIDTAGQIIGGRFFDAANMIRLNLDFIANEAVGYITSTDYKNPAFTLTSGDYTSCKDDIKDILKAITVDITKGGNVQSVGAGRSYYNGNTLLYIADPNVKAASIAAIGAAATVARYVINNAPLLKSYQSGVSSIRQIRDLTLQDDPIVGVNISPNGCSNVVSAIYTCAGIVTTIIGNGPNTVSVNNPDGKIIWAPAGADSRNLIWVSKYGNDDNGGKTEGDAKLTIGAAAAIAEPGDTITIRPGVYYENNPIGLRTDVGVSGQDLRLVTVVPRNSGKDIFHVRRGCLIENMNFSCDTGQSNLGGGALAFPPTTTDIVAGKSFGAVTGYLAPGPATEGPSGRWRSPYVRNCTNFMPLSIGMKINGDHAVSSTIGADLKCMVCDSFTQYNEAGIGVSITNNGYAQLVSIFTINCDKAIYVDTGGSCDLTNSNSSFGNFGLYAVGLGRTEFTAKVNTTTTAESDIIVFKNVSDGTQTRRPYDGQALWFKINLSNYTTGQTGIITAPLQRLKSVTVINGGSGYSAASPPDISIYDSNTNSSNPLGPEGIIAEVSPTINDSGAITAVDIINSGRNYLSSQNIKVRINGADTNDLIASMEPIYYTVSEATLQTPVTGISTVTLNEFVPYLVYAEDSIEMRRISRILTSGHSFEYIGTGTDINTSTPLKGAVPIKENEIVALDGAQIPYTSTDQKGNFNIGEGIQVDQTTSTITGRDFSKAIQAQVTPLILALR